MNSILVFKNNESQLKYWGPTLTLSRKTFWIACRRPRSVREFPVEYRLSVSILALGSATLSLCSINWHRRRMWTKDQSSTTVETCDFAWHCLPSFCHERWPLGSLPSAGVSIGHKQRMAMKSLVVPGSLWLPPQQKKRIIFLLPASHKESSLYRVLLLVHSTHIYSCFALSLSQGLCFLPTFPGISSHSPHVWKQNGFVLL